jgi:Tol biopolymer transport system component
MGTAGYMSPEQVRGKPLDKRSDNFSFGCVLYEMLTGVQAFRGDTVADSIGATLHKEHDQSPLPANTPANVTRLLHRCLAKDKRHRLRDIGDARLELVATEHSDASPSASMRKMRPAIAAAVALLAVGAVTLLAFVAGYVIAHRSEPVPILRASIELPAGEQLEVLDASIALTADGRNMAITTTDPAGNTRIWTRSLDSTKWQLMAGTDGASYPFWSPDGRSLAFFKDGKLKKLDIASGAVQTICDAPDARGGSWGSEGQILFAPAPFGALELVSSDGGTPVPVTDARANEGISHRMPHFLPDDHHVLFASSKSSDPGNNANGIYFLDLKTRSVRQVISSGFEGLYVSPGYLVYARDGNLVAQPFDPGSGQMSGSPTVIAEAIVLNTARLTGAYALSQNGMLVTYTASQMSQLTWFDLDGRKLGTLGSPALYAVPPVISRDDRHVLAQIGDLSEVTTGPYWYDVVRGVGTKLPIPDHQNSALSPDDKTILYRASSGTLKTYRLDGSAAPAVVLSGSKIPYVAAFNPDGRSALYCIQQLGQMDLRFLSVASGESRSFGLVPGSSCVGTFSPDGRWLAFQSVESGQNEIYVAPVGNANDKRQVSSGGGFLPVWRGNKIYYVNGQRKLMAVDLKLSANGFEIGVAKETLGGQVFGGQLLAVGTLGTGDYITHDGKRVLLPISVTDTAPPLSVVTNWTETLKR